MDSVKDILYCPKHPGAVAKWYCPECMGDRCEFCVTLYNTPAGPLASCKICGGQCAPLVDDRTDKPLVDETQPEARPNLLEQLPALLRYPVQGGGIYKLAAGAGILALAAFLGDVAYVHWFTSFIAAALIGGYLMRIIDGSCRAETTMPVWPNIDNWFDDLIVPLLKMFAVVILCFGPATIWYRFFGNDPIFWVLLLPGVAYFPLAAAAMSLFESLEEILPSRIIPSFRKIEDEYILTLIVLSVLALACNGFGTTVGTSWLVGTPLASIANFYVLSLGAHIIGWLYAAEASRLRWFETTPPRRKRQPDAPPAQ